MSSELVSLVITLSSEFPQQAGIDANGRSANRPKHSETRGFLESPRTIEPAHELFKSPSDTTRNPRGNGQLRPMVSMVVDDFELGGFVDSAAAFGCCIGQQGDGIGEAVDDIADLFFGHAGPTSSIPESDKETLGRPICKQAAISVINRCD